MTIRAKSLANLKYYLYISSAKLDMLYAQVEGPEKKKITWDFKIDLKVVSAQRKAEAEEDVDCGVKLRTVIQELEAAGQVGTVEEPKEYLRGILPMRWGMYDDNGRPDNEAPLVFFGARTKTRMLGFGGSSKHVVGFTGASSTGSRSVTPYLLGWLLHGLEQPIEGWHASYYTGTSDDYQVFQALDCALSNIKGPEQNLEFFARTLLKGRTTVKHHWVEGLLGTPLFVALAPPYPTDLW